MNIINQLLENLYHQDLIILSDEYIKENFGAYTIKDAIRKEKGGEKEMGNTLIDSIEYDFFTDEYSLQRFYYPNNKRDIIYYYFSKEEFKTIFNIDYLEKIYTKMELEFQNKKVTTKKKNTFINNLIIHDLNLYNKTMKRNIKTKKEII